MFVQYRPGRDVWAFGVEPAKVKYRLRLARYPALAEYLADWVANRASAGDRGFKLLDIGAGMGRTFLYLQAADLDQHFQMIGLDIDPGRKDAVYANNPWDIRQGDAEQGLDFPDNSLDVVVCEQLLEHLNHPQRVIEEVQRVLKDDGLFFCGVPIFPEPVAKLRRWWVKRNGLGRSDHIQTYSLRSIRQQLSPRFVEIEARGFRIVSGGLLRRLENHAWWYRFNRRLGRFVPGLCIEVQLILQPSRVESDG
ncbi:MAG: class I SAM-dependent methyltransferase [Pseudomonadota bacterium]